MNHGYANRLALTNAARLPTLRPGLRSSRRKPLRQLRVDLTGGAAAGLPKRASAGVIWGWY